MTLKKLNGDDAAVIEAVRHLDNFKIYPRRRMADHRQNVETVAEPFFNNLTRIVADEFIYRAPGSRTFDIAALGQLLVRQEQLLAGQERLLDRQAEANERLTEAATDIQEVRRAVARNRSAPPTRIRSGDHPRVAVNFVKREEQDELFGAIFTYAEPCTVLTGVRGYGKTQLAAAVVTRCEEGGWLLVAWINAASREELIADLHELALRTGIDAPKEVPPETIIRRFLDQLRSTDVADCLLVFDNVKNLSDLRNPTPEGSGVRAITTITYHLDWDSQGWHPVTVGIFERDQSITILYERSGDTHREAADQIVEALGNLPVTIIQTAATVKRGGYVLSDYLGGLSNHPLEPSISRLEGDNYPDAVGVALFMVYEQALERIRSKHPQQERIAISLLDVLSLLAASGVPTHWFLGLDDNSDTVRVTLSFLKRSSILQESISGSKTIVHRLQGQVYRETYLSGHGKFNRACTYAATILDKVDIGQLASFKRQRQEARSLVKQIDAVTLRDHSHPLFFDSDFVVLLATTIRNAVSLGMPQLALTLTGSVTQAGDILGPAHPSALASRNNLARAHYDASRLDEAVTLYGQTLEDHTRILGPRHPGTLTSRNNLANAHQDAGRLDEAITLYEQTLEDRTHTLGPHHPDTLTSRNNLASAYQDAGGLGEVATLHEQTLRDHTHILEPHRPSTLTSHNNLANVYQATGRLDDTITLHKQNLKDRTRILGPHHPDTLTSRNNLASVYQVADGPDDTITLHRQNLRNCARILGPHHPSTLISRNNLAGTYQTVGRLGDAITLYEQTLTDSTHILGPNHPDTLTSRNNLAGAYQTADRLDGTITLHKQNLKNSIHILGPHHPDTLTPRNDLANAYRDTSRLDDAITLHKQNLKDSVHILEPYHPRTLISRDNLASTCRDTGRLDEAITLYKRNFEDRIHIPGPNHPHTLTSRNSLTSTYRAAGRIGEAKKLFEIPSDLEGGQDGTKQDQGQETGD